MSDMKMGKLFWPLSNPKTMIKTLKFKLKY